jgi:hypothetical protein
LALTHLVLALTHLVLALTHLVLALTHLALALTLLVLALTHLALALTLLVLPVTLLVLALTHLALALTLLVLPLARWLLALDSQTQRMAARDGTPESRAPPHQRAQWPQQSNANASTLDGVAAPARRQRVHRSRAGAELRSHRGSRPSVSAVADRRSSAWSFHPPLCAIYTIFASGAKIQTLAANIARC